MNTCILLIRAPAIIPLMKQLIALGRADERQFRDAPTRVGDDAFQQGLEMIQHASDGLFLEQACVVFQ